MAHEVFMKWNAPSRTGVYVGFSDRWAAACTNASL